MKELAYREFNGAPIDFNGIILIDEIDLHLHPDWQARLVLALKEIFPKAQFILTTHSPSVLQVLEKEELIPLKSDDEGNSHNCIDELNLGDYGLQGWTLEEILTDVMGVPSTSSSLYEDTIKAFDKAMDEENKEGIIKNYNLLL